MAEKKPAAKAGRKTSFTKAKSKTNADDATPNTAPSALIDAEPQKSTTAEQVTPKTVRATVTARNGVNVRTTPEKGDNVKRVLPCGTEVTVQAQTTDAQGTEWAQIAPHEFIMRRFLRVQ